MAVRLEILGDVRLLVDGAEVEIRREQVRRALVLLGARAPQPVTRDQLIEHLWGARLPTDPHASLRVALSRVRTTLGQASECLRSHPHGYALLVDTDAADFNRLLDAAASASDEAAIELRTQALSLVGDPPAHLFDEPLIESFAADLWRARSFAISERIYALSRLGRHEDVVAAAVPAFADDDTNEGFAVQAAQALAATGRRSEALRILDRCRKQLRDQLGLIPSDGFSSVEGAIIRGDSTSSGKLAGIAAPATARARFVGRKPQLDHLALATGGLWLIMGESGSGKTALLDQLENRLVASGRPFLRARATRTPTRPMETLATLLSAITQVVAPQDQSETLCSVVARLAPEHSHRDMKPPGSREALLALTTQALEDHAEATGAVYLIDDMHWLDRSSGHVIEALAESQQATLIATTRDAFPEHLDFMTQGQALDQTLQLGPLSEADVAELVATELPMLPHAETVQRVHDRSAGNALFVSLLIDLLGEGALNEAALPPSILVSVRRRIESLSGSAQRTLEVASVFTDTFSLDVLSELEPGAGEHVVEALGEGLVASADEEGQYRFTHTLVAEGAYQLLPEGQRIQLHDEIGRVLERSGASPAQFALHCGEAASLDPYRAVDAHRLAAHQFAGSFDWDTALLHAERGLRHLDDFGLDDTGARSELLIIAGSAFRAQAIPEGDRLLIDGVSLGSLAVDPAVAVTGIVALCTHGRMSTDEGPVIHELVTAMLERQLTEGQRAQVLAAESTLLSISPQQPRAREAFREALELVASCDDETAQREVLSRTHLGLPHPEDFPLRLRATDMLAEIAGSDPDLHWEVAFLRFGNAMVSNDAGAAAESLATMREYTPRIRQRQRDFGMQFSEAAWARFNGDLDGAEDLLNAAIETGQAAFGNGWNRFTYAAVMSSIREAQGRLHELLPLVDDWISADPEWPTWHVMAAACAASAGHADRVRRELTWLKRDNFECLSPDVSWPAMFSVLTEPVALVNDREAAASLLEHVMPYAGMNLWNGACIHQSADAVIEKLVAVSTGSSQ